MTYIAADFGAGSGRIIVGTATSKGITLDEIHRFPNRQIRLGNTLYWDFLSLFEELKTGLKKAFASYSDIKSIGVDTWGVDFGLLDKQGKLISNPVCYRDCRTAGILEKVFNIVSRLDFYNRTGNQFMEINTVFQLYSMVVNNEPALKMGNKLLFMPDLFNYFLSGVAVNEYTISSTSQLYNHAEKGWDREILHRLNIPDIMQEIVPAGTVLGGLLSGIISETGGYPIDVIAVGAHDTASALASINAQGNDWAFISSGTWSLMGIEANEPIITKTAMNCGFTNEGTVNGRTRFLKNITGLWLLQNVMKEWEDKGERCSYADIIAEAGKSDFHSIIDVDDAVFSHPECMSEAIRSYCRRNGQPLPETKGEYMRCISLSLATKYAEVKKQLEQCSGREINTIYIVGGGSRNTLLNQLTAKLTGAKVIVGEAEATAIGNILTQIQTLSPN